MALQTTLRINSQSKKRKLEAGWVMGAKSRDSMRRAAHCQLGCPQKAGLRKGMAMSLKSTRGQVGT